MVQQKHLFSIIWVYDEIVTKFVLNAMLHHVVMSWIISSNREMEYEMNKTDHQDWLNKGPWYNRPICSKLQGIRFEDFISVHADTIGRLVYKVYQL